MRSIYGTSEAAHQAMAMTASTTPVINVGITVEKKSSPVSKIIRTNAASEVRVLKRTEYKEAAATLAEAFRDDHVIRYPIDTPDRENWSEEQRFNLHRQAFEYITYAHCLKGLVLSIGEGHGCVALWMPPGKNMDDWLTILRSGMWRLSYQLSAEGRKRFFEEFLPLLGNTKAEVLVERDDESWYLVYIGTKEESRGKGYARKLVDHVTKKVRRMLGVAFRTH